MKPPPQEKIFYPETNVWCIGSEELLVNVLADHAEESGQIITDRCDSLNRARRLINKKYDNKFGRTAVRQRFNMLRNRHHDFSRIIQMNGVQYDAISNTITASKTTLKDMMQVLYSLWLSYFSWIYGGLESSHTIFIDFGSFAELYVRESLLLPRRDSVG